jgi:hypothetical protein
MLGSIRMKKIAFVLAAAGLMSLAACHKTPDTAVANNESDMAAALDNTAGNLDDMAAATTNDVAANALSNASDAVSAASDNISAAASNGQ